MNLVSVAVILALLEKLRELPSSTGQKGRLSVVM
jgi:hypothetical protein